MWLLLETLTGHKMMCEQCLVESDQVLVVYQFLLTFYTHTEEEALFAACMGNLNVSLVLFEKKC